MKLGTLLRISNVNEVDSKFEILKNNGFEACQIVYKPEVYTKEDAQIIKASAEKYGIDISAQFCGYYDEDTVWDNYYGFLTAGLNVETYRKSRVDYIKKAAEFAKEAGITDIVIHAGYIPNNPFAPEYASLLTAIDMLCRHLKTLEMNLLLETGGESAVTLLRLIKDSGHDNLFINMDPANMLMYGYANPIDFIYTVGQYVRNVHGKDGVPPTDPRVLGAETPVGEGRVDFYGMFRDLKEKGYDRYIIIEREISGEKQTEDVLKAKKYFEKMLDELGY